MENSHDILKKNSLHNASQPLQFMYKILGKNFDPHTNQIYFGLTKELNSKRYSIQSTYHVTLDNMTLPFPTNSAIKNIIIIEDVTQILIFPEGIESVTYIGGSNLRNSDVSLLPSTVKSIIFKKFFDFTRAGIDFSGENPHPEAIQLSEKYNRPLCKFSNLSHLDLGPECYWNIGNLPPNLTHLRSTFEHLSIETLPRTLRHLTLGSYFNSQVDSLPPNLTHLEFGCYFNQPVSNLPRTLKKLIFGVHFEQPLNPILRELTSLTHLTVGNLCEHLEFLPSSLVYFQTKSDSNYDRGLPDFSRSPLLKTLILERHRNYPLNKLFARSIGSSDSNSKTILSNTFPNLRKITFESSFNQVISSLPQTLTHITFGDQFNSEVNDLPKSLTNLIFCRAFNQTVDYLPPNLDLLSFGENFNQNVNHLPLSLTSLGFESWSMMHRFNKPIDNLSPSLKMLVLGSDFNQKIDHLPSNLKYLTLGDNFNRHIDNLPLELTHLTLGKKFNKKIDNLPRISHLRLTGNFNQSIDFLPDSLIYLRLGLAFNETLDHLPSSIFYLILSDKFNRKVEVWPPFLTHLGLGYSILPLDNLPRTLIHLMYRLIPQLVYKDRPYLKLSQYIADINLWFHS